MATLTAFYTDQADVDTWAASIEAITSVYASNTVGASKALSAIIADKLHEDGVGFMRVCGNVTSNATGACIGQFWVIVPYILNGESKHLYIDHRLQDFFGTDATIPDGIFDPEDFPEVVYKVDFVVKMEDYSPPEIHDERVYMDTEHLTP